MATIHITDKKVPYDAYLLQKLELMIKRVTQKSPKQDAVLQIEGPEGSGKTTMAIGIAYYVSLRTGRAFNEKNVFFDTKKALEFAQNTEDQIIIFDEPALDVLSSQWWKETQQNLIQLLMLFRKKRHFLIFNFTKFYKFSEYIVVDRSVGMIHLYERRDKAGQYAFTYIPQASLEYLYNDYRYKKQRNYFKYGIFTGEFADILNPDRDYNILDKFNVTYYEAEKDKAIKSIGSTKNNKLKELQARISRVKFPIYTQEQFCELTKIPDRTLRRWKNMDFEVQNDDI